MTNRPMRILVLGASGMLGYAVLRFFIESPGFEIFGSVRSPSTLKLIPKNLHHKIITNVNVDNFDNLTSVFANVHPDLVINCIGLVKQLNCSDDPLITIPINSLLPHRLSKLCEIVGARLVHISTDCVFSGIKGMYAESDISDAYDLYGRSKYLGEVNYPNTITLRTSIIGHEIDGARSLVNWFLKQEGSVKGFRNAIFSGLPTVEIALIIRDYVIPNPELQGLYHVSAQPINKHELLCLIALEYKKNINIIPDDEFSIDRSLNSDRFRLATGYQPPEWSTLIKSMYEFNHINRF